MISKTKRGKYTYKNGGNYGLSVNNKDQINYDILKHLKNQFKTNGYHRFNSYVR